MTRRTRPETRKASERKIIILIKIIILGKTKLKRMKSRIRSFLATNRDRGEDWIVDSEITINMMNKRERIKNYKKL